MESNLQLSTESKPLDLASLMTLEGVISTEGSERDEFFNSLFSGSRSDQSHTPIKISNPDNSRQAVGVDSVILKTWKNIANISARLLDTYDNSVVLECLIDKEEGIYEERIFRASLFEGYDLQIGKRFLLRFFDRGNEARIEVHDNAGLTSEADFPPTHFKETFKKSSLFK